jgi:hypothetical protein
MTVVRAFTAEETQDIVAAMIAAGAQSGVTISYDDTAGSLSFTVPAGYTNEQAQDAVATMIAAGTHAGISFSYNDAANSLSASVTATSYTDEQAQDAIAAMIAAGTHAGITFSYNDATNSLSATVTGAPVSGAAGGVLSGSYPNPGFAVDMATQAELDTVSAAAYTDERAQDALGALIAAGSQSGITVTYNDAAGTLSFTVPASYSNEEAQDAVAAMIAAGSHVGITFAYNDATNSISATAAGTYTDEAAQDAIVSMLSAGTHSGISFTYNDVANSLSSTVPASYTDEQAQDATAAALAAGTHTNLTVTYNDAANSLSLAASGGGSSTVEALLGMFDTHNTAYAGGAKADLRRSDGTTTAGSTTVTGTFLASNADAGKICCFDGAGVVLDSGTADGVMNYALPDTNKFSVPSGVAFDSTYIGRYITVTGAGAAGAVLTTRILGVENSTTLRLRAPRGTSVSGVDWSISEDLYATVTASTATSLTLDTAAGRAVTNAQGWLGTDDAPAIQACINAAEAANNSGSGNTVYHYGSSAIGAALNITKPTQFLGLGPRGYSKTLSHSATKLRLLKPGIGGIVTCGTSHGMGTTGSITSGTATLTDPKANFVAGDVGKNIIIYGGGTQTGSTDGVHVLGTISTRNSATSVTISTNAGTTLSGNAIYEYCTGAGYPGGLQGPTIRHLQIEGGAGQKYGINLVNASEFIVEDVCVSDFISGVGFMDGGGPAAASFSNNSELRSCYAIDCRIGVYQYRGSLAITGQMMIDGNSNRVDCRMTNVGSMGIYCQNLDVAGSLSIQAVETGIRANGRGNSSNINAPSLATMENVNLMFDMMSDGAFGNDSSKVAVHSCGNSNAGGTSYQLLLRAGVRNFQYAPGFYLEGDMDLLHPSCNAAALRELQLSGQRISKPGPITDADFRHAPIDGATGVDTNTNRFFCRIGGAWRYVATTGFASRVKVVQVQENLTVLATRTLTVPTGGVVAGHHIILGWAYSAAANRTVTVTDSKSNTWQNDSVADKITGLTPHAGISSCRVTNALVAGDTITITLDVASAFLCGAAYDYVGIAPASWLDQAVTTANTGVSTTPSSGNITTTNANDVLFGVVFNGGATLATWTEDASYNRLVSDGLSGTKRFNVEDFNVFATGTYAAGGTLSTSNDWAVALAAYKAA